MANELFPQTTIREVIAGLAHDIEEKTGRPFIDFKWPPRLVYFHLINQRAEIYYQTRRQNQMEGNYEDYTEVLPCVEMKEVDLVECPCAPASGCTFMKIVKPLPKFIGGRPAAVTTLTGFDRYNYVPWEMFKYRINNRHAGLNKSFLFTTQTINNEIWLYTYITNDVKARSVKVSGVPIDPMEIVMYPVCGKEPPDMCEVLDYKFIIEKRLTRVLYDATFKALVNYNNGTRIGDTKNDDRSAETATDPRY